ncbi:MAG: hypothetical protein LIR50_14430 [Bacillota bacterium]|nr:hypothetical protein [Bacillota bacterium]
MINVNDIVTIGGVVVGVIGGIYGLVPYLKKKGVNTEKVLDTTQNVLEAAEPLIQVAKTIPSLKVGANLVDLMQDKAISAAKIAEQLEHAGQLKNNDEKFNYARDIVYSILKEMNVTPTDNQKKLIDDFIQEGVNNLGHAPVSEAEKNAQIAKTQQDLTIAQTENAQLKQKLTTIQSTAGATVTQQPVQAPVQQSTPTTPAQDTTTQTTSTKTE